MASIGFRIYRGISLVWTGETSDPFARFARSSAFTPAMLALLLAGLGSFFFLAPASPDAAGEDLALQLLWGVGLVGFISSWLLLYLSAGASSVCSVRHTQAPEALLARCREILERHGFSVTAGPASTLEAKRGAFGGLNHSHGAEIEWRRFPLHVTAAAASDGSSSLHVSCTGIGGFFGTGKFGRTRELTAATCEALAALDGQALERLDATIAVEQGRISLGGLATTIFNVLLGSALLTAAIVAGVSYLVGAWALQFAEADALRGNLGRLTLQIYSDTDRPLRTAVERLSDSLGKGNATGEAPVAALRALDASGLPGVLVAGVRMRDGNVAFAYPAESSPLRVHLPEILREMQSAPRGLYRAGDRVFRRLAAPYTADLAARLGLTPEQGELIIGVALAHEELARLAPRIGLFGLEMTFFEAGRPFVRYRWPETFGKEPVVDGGAGTLPAEVISALAQEHGSSETAVFRHILFGGAMSGMVIRTESRGGLAYRVIYAGSERAGAGTGWSGISVAEKHDPAFDPRSEILSLATLVALLVLLPILFISAAIALPVSARITRPVLRVRDALRTIAQGDYSARVEVTHTDEIGQLQRLVNDLAGELRKRESIKELMGKYLSKQVADRIMESDSGETLAGVRREVSVLFADVRGFTTYSEKHDPEQVTKSLNEYFEVMVDVIASHEGVLDKYIGDGLMVVFGAPMAQEDHARRAVNTALEMQAALQSLNLRRAQRGDDPIHIGIGVNTGLAISGNLGSLKRMEFTVIGDTVNTAARLESNAKQGQILIGRATYERVEDLIECEPLGQITVKGKAEPVEVWWLKGLKPRRP